MDAQCSIPGCGELIGSANGWAHLNLLSPAGGREGTVCSRHAYCLASLLNGEDVVVPAQDAVTAGYVPYGIETVCRSKILVVDDDVAIAEALSDLLQDEGYEVVRAGNGEEALATLHRDSAIRLIILDLMMPGMDGASFRCAQKEDPALAVIPVIIISAMNRAADAAALLGPAAVLTKPINVPTLLDRVGMLC